MEQYRYRYVDAYEKADGVIEAMDIGGAAIAVLQECGTEPNRPRWKRYGIKERLVAECPRDAELVVFSRINEYHLELSKVGTRKRKPLRLYA